ncbi:MAG: hypothetical protein AAFP69_22910, partial [Planctomycetota bacterium]
MHERESSIDGDELVSDLLFTKVDHPEGDRVQMSADPQRFFRRVIKPVLDLEKVGEMLEWVEVRPEVMDVIRGGIKKHSFADDYEHDAFGKQLRDEMVLAIKGTVALPDNFMRQHFSLARVVGNLSVAWKNRLNQPMSVDQKKDLESVFKNQFGFVPESEERADTAQYVMPDSDTIVHHMAADLAKNCKPYWQVSRDELDAPFDVSLFFETSRSQQESTAAISNRLATEFEGFNATITVNPRDDNNSSTDNPFLLIAYSTEGIDDLNKIRSLDYHKDAEVQRYIKLAEDPSGTTIFGGDGCEGLGYTTPYYVNNEHLNQIRWKPWANTVAADAKKHADRAIDALLYALLPGDGEAPELVDLTTKLQERGWPMPLFRVEKGNRLGLSRLPLIEHDGGFRTDNQIGHLNGWDVGKSVASKAGMHSVLARLTEEPDGESWIDRLH